MLWRCRADDAPTTSLWQPATIATPSYYGLRRWPHPTNRPRLRWIHHVLHWAKSHGCPWVPVPCVDRSGESLLEISGAPWELSPWIPGTPNYHSQPSRPKLAAAMQALASFHHAVRSHGTIAWNKQSVSIAMGVLEKLRLVRQFAQVHAAQIQDASHHNPIASTVFISESLRDFRQSAPQVEQLLVQAARVASSVPLQPVIRDVWHDHVLFKETDFQGIVDFGAMSIDNVATDVARLLGSLARNNPEDWHRGMDAYQSLRPLSHEERQLVHASHVAIRLLSCMQWLYWLVVEQKRFDDPERVAVRLEACRADLAGLGNWL